MITRRDAIKLGLWSAAATAAAFQSRGESRGVLVTRPIPSSGEKLPVIGIGTARRFDVTTAAEKAPLREVLRELPRMGGRLVDTAPSYGAAEDVVGELVAELGNRDSLFLASKVGAGRNGAAAGLAELNASLKRLRTNKLDLVQIHNLAGVDEMLPILRKWKDEGRIRYHGISTSSDGQYDALEAIMKREKLDFIQIDYAMDNRLADERILPLAADRGIAVLTNLPFGRGRVLSAFKDKAIPDWAQELGIASWAQFALKWVVSHPAVTAAIPGTAKIEYLRDNLGAARGPMPDAATRRKMVELLG
ncbi:MAG TPA: aldo/keto reductase [Thermoanaerobaculia bacterium]|nr:aldo/keto reductase [Thermoanaerobaculia bacterium]